MASRPPISGDGLWYWDGAAWRSLLSADGAFVWNGESWTPRYPVPAPGRQRSGRGLAWALVGGGAAATLALVVLIGVLVAVLLPSAAGTAPAQAATGSTIPCQPTEQLTGHYHSHLLILAGGQFEPVPAQIGIEAGCIRWLHTHDTSGLIHVEIPGSQRHRTFYLSQFFSVWGQPLSDSRVASWSGGVTAWLQAPGEAQPHRWVGGVDQLALADCESITLEVGAPWGTPPGYRFPTGFGC